MFDSADRERRLDEVVAAYLEAVEAGLAPDRSAFLKQNPDLADELAAFFADERQFDSLVAPLRMPSEADTTPHLDGSALPLELGDYELLGEIARGGMGVVFEARQKSLNRIVAVKMIRSGRLASPANVQRFRLEAEAAASLDHPNIVPIHEVGIHEGQPFFSMKRIIGGSLAQHDGRFTRDPREAVRLIVQVARAVDHAHQRGILHRDLKPANILLSVSRPPEGVRSERAPLGWRLTEEVPFVTDFGLAKRLGNASSLTQSGITVGTPSYMAPEQAGGKDAVTTAADIYSLGAILYELVAGQPPFRAEVALETMRQVLDQEPRPPRDLNPGLDRDLSTVVLKCLDKDPARRYASAAALADDLQRYLDGEPILGRQPSRVERLARWVRRNPALALLGSVAALALVAVTGVSLALYLREAENTRQMALLAEARQRALDDAGRHARDSEASFHDAHQAVTNFILNVSDEMSKAPSLLPLQKELLGQALEYYHRFLAKRGDDPHLKAELAEAYFQAARITSTIGSKAEALGLYRKALPLYEEMARAHPGDPYYESDVGHTLHNIAILESALGRPEPAWEATRQAAEIAERLARAEPRHVPRLEDLASAWQLLAVHARDQGRQDEALDLYVRTRTLREQLVCAEPRVTRHQGEWALCINNMGVHLAQIDRPEEARQCYLTALAIRQSLVAATPRSHGALIALAASLRDLGIVSDRLGQREEALRYFQDALALREQLAADNPSINLYQSDLAASLSDLVPIYRGQKELKKALDCSQRAIAILKKLADADPGVLHYQSDLAHCHFDIGLILSDNRQREDALRAYRNARAIQDKVVEAAPERVDYHGDLGSTLHNLALVLARLDRHDEAVATLREAIEHQKRGFSKFPRVPRYRQALAGHYASLAEVYRVVGKPAEAFAATRERRTLADGDGGELFRAACDFALAADVVGRGQAVLDDVQKAEREAYRDEAMATLRQALAAGFHDTPRLRTDARLAGLRPRDDFAVLLDGLP